MPIKKKMFLAVAFICMVGILTVGPKYNIKTVDLANKFSACSSVHWMGTDNLGRDIYSLIASGGVRTLLVTIIALTIACLGGSFIGTVAVFAPSMIRSLIQFFSDLTLTIPSFMLALVLSAVLGFSPLLVGIVLGIGNMGDYINQAFDLASAIREEEYIQAEEILGAGSLRIIVLHVLPNIAVQLFVFMGNHVSSIVIQYAGLAYIGLGTDYTNPDWGALLYQYRPYMITHPMLVIWPALAICMLTLISHSIFDDGKDKQRGAIGYD